MSSAGEPEVEVLTAELRVLRVGAKDLTRSAARQLDSVDGAGIKPFGRVRIDRKPADGLIEVVGSVNGVLARSSARATKFECPGYASSSLHDFSYGPKPRVCARHRDTSPGPADDTHVWTEYTPSQKIYEAWQAMPLIVLAGLR